MAELVAKDQSGQELWRKALPFDPVTLGRESGKSDWVAPDGKISRVHARLIWDEKEHRLRVCHLETGSNPIICRGQKTKRGDEIRIGPAEEFFIGDTQFSLVEGTILQPGTPDLPPPITELTCSQEELKKVPFTDAADRIGILTDLPEIIRYSPSEEELGRRVVEVLRRGIPRAKAAAVVRLAQDEAAQDPMVAVEYVDLQDKRVKDFRPSSRLVRDALQRLRQSVLHVWDIGATQRAPAGSPTPNADFNWALCVPLPEDPAPGWGLYVAGRLERERAGFGSPRQDLLKGDLKFAELVAGIYGSLRRVVDLQKRQTVLADFFPLPVRNALGNRNMEEVLQARQTEVTVLFCDLRGSVQIAEEGQEDLETLWHQVSPALNIMAGCIIDRDGVIGDFQGDAAMGFWGWPIASDDQVEKAARAALTIQKNFAKLAALPNRSGHAFRCGIGIAHGPAMAGRLGAFDQFKIDVFGPTVNLASRLESMTKFFQVPILIDEASAARLADLGTGLWGRCRQVSQLQPVGMKKTVLMVSELLPPVGERHAMSEVMRREYEAALGLFRKGQWEEARKLFEHFSKDGASQFHLDFMKLHNGKPPDDWNGVIVMKAK